MKIILMDGSDVPDSENMAMLQALYSRDSRSVLDQLKVNRNSDKFFENYVVNYGHGSIAQCGDITLFCEGVSMRLAKIIQFHNYYVGQEVSTRYIDFSSYTADNLVYYSDTELSEQLNLLEHYRYSLFHHKNLIAAHNFGKKYDNLSEKEQKMVNPKAFDKARGLLPFGAKTNVSWKTNFDNLWKHLSFINTHFCDDESQNFVIDTLFKVKERYPHSIPDLLGQKGTGASRESMGNSPRPLLRNNDFEKAFDYKVFGTNTDLIDVSIKGSMDIGGWRDIQRHRNTTQSYPSFKPDESGGLHPYYLGYQGYTMPAILRTAQANPLNSLPLGSMVDFSLKMSLSQMHYIIKARYQETVHPIVRVEILRWIKLLKANNLPVPLGLRPEVLESIEGSLTNLDISAKRSNQTITRA